VRRRPVVILWKVHVYGCSDIVGSSHIQLAGSFYLGSHIDRLRFIQWCVLSSSESY